MFNLFANKEARSLENPQVSLSSASAWNEFFNLAPTVTGDSVTEEKALGVTAIWQAVNAVAGTIASLPLHVYKRTEDGAEKDTRNPLYYLIHDRPNDYQTSSAFNRWLVSRLMLQGRGTALISRDKVGRVSGLWPLDPNKLEIKQGLDGGTIKRTYTYKLDTGSAVYDSANVIDVALFPKSDAVDCYNPIHTNRDAIALMIAAQEFAGKLFASGGVPPLMLTSPVAISPQGAARASNDIGEAVKASQRTRSNVMVVPAGHDLKPVGLDPAKSQLIELRQFLISEASRIFNVAPAVLHDLSNGTYSNVEQQMLSLGRQTLHPLIEAIEQEMNAKLFGPRNTKGYVEFSMDGLQRGDFVSRMDGYQKAIHAAIMTPNEARAFENLPPLEGGDRLYIQGATVPLENAAKPEPQPEPQPEPDTTPTDPANEEGNDDTQEDAA